MKVDVDLERLFFCCGDSGNMMFVCLCLSGKLAASEWRTCFLLVFSSEKWSVPAHRPSSSLFWKDVTSPLSGSISQRRLNFTPLFSVKPAFLS